MTPSPIRAAALALVLAVVLAGGPVLACSPMIIEPASEPRRGPDCALAFDLDETDIVSLGSAVPLSAGMFLQPLSDGNGCYNRQNLLVHDCNAGRVMVIGTEHFSLMESMERGPGRISGLEVIRDLALAAHAAGRTQSLDDFAAQSRAQGYGTPLVVATTQRLQYGNRRLPLDCACRTARRSG